MQELKNAVKDKELENRVLLQEIEELNVSVNERQHIQDASGKSGRGCEQGLVLSGKCLLVVPTFKDNVWMSLQQNKQVCSQRFLL